MPGVIIGTVVDPSPQPIGDGQSIHQAWKAQALTGSGYITAVYKRLEPEEIAIECLCAVIGRTLGLPVPQPAILRLPDGSNAFGLVHVSGRDLRHLLSADAKSAVSLLEQWENLNKAAIFDEFIANWDRNPGNLIYDGGAFWLIDHNLAFDRSATKVNILAENIIKCLLKDLAVRRLLKEASSQKGRYARLDLDKSAAEAFASKHFASFMISFLENRGDVEHLLRERLGRGSLL